MYFRTFFLRNIIPDEPTDFGELSRAEPKAVEPGLLAGLIVF